MLPGEGVGIFMPPRVNSFGNARRKKAKLWLYFASVRRAGLGDSSEPHCPQSLGRLV